MPKPLPRIKITGFDAPSSMSWKPGERQSVIGLFDNPPPKRWIRLFEKEVAKRGADITCSEPMIKKVSLVFFATPENIHGLIEAFREIVATVDVTYIANALSDPDHGKPFAP